MMELIIIAITAALLSNVVLSQFLGICSFLGVSTKTDVAMGMGGAVVFVITVASAVAYFLYLILEALGITYLDTIVFI
ncbi:MAG: electron transport complex subunit RsxA, partial [Lachnospiraceae bacterium]|nr:electron transport complex subunit RsxA [Lachnospiraceae bacterium]